MSSPLESSLPELSHRENSHFHLLNGVFWSLECPRPSWKLLRTTNGRVTIFQKVPYDHQTSVVEVFSVSKKTTAKTQDLFCPHTHRIDIIKQPVNHPVTLQNLLGRNFRKTKWRCPTIPSLLRYILLHTNAPRTPREMYRVLFSKREQTLINFQPFSQGSREDLGKIDPIFSFLSCPSETMETYL